MFKRGILIILLFCTLSSLAEGRYIDYSFCDEGSTPLNNVKIIGWRCEPKSSSTCSNVDRNFPTSTDTMPLSSGSSNFIRMNLVVPQAGTDYYIWYFYEPNYRAVKVISTLPTSSGNTVWFTRNCQLDTILTKKDNCQATFSPAITSCAEAGLPLSILTDTQLDANTQSAFISSGVYWPPELQAWRNVNTRMTVDIKKQGTTSSLQGYPTNQEYNIYANTTHDFNFLWQTSRNTEPGTYVITMTSTVPDAKCDQTTMVPTTNTINVFVAPTLDGCRAELQNFATTTTNFVLNQPVNFAGKRLHEYQDWNYTSISSCQASNAQLLGAQLFDADYNLTIINSSNNKAVYSIKSTFSRNSNFNSPLNFTVSWPTAKAGSFVANFKITSIDSGVCQNNGNTATVSTAISVGRDNDNDRVYDIEGDCDDNNRYIFPGNSNLHCNCNTGDGKNVAAETCDQIDNNCNGVVDDGINCATTNYYCDNDADGLFSIPVTGTCQGTNCFPANCRNTTGTDCDDTNSQIQLKQIYQQDLDGDAFGNPAISVTVCPQDKPATYVSATDDCNDNNPNIRPTATEICNSLDDNCNFQVDENNVCASTPYYCDMDIDTYFSTTYSGLCTGLNCVPQECRSQQGTDCKDNNVSINPGRPELCNNIDDNCNNIIDENNACSGNPYYCDSDNDGVYSSIPSGTCIGNNCLPIACTNNPGQDCNDNIREIKPGNTEQCNGIDDNCNFQVDENVQEAEICDNRDNNCNGLIDDVPPQSCGNTYPQAGVCLEFRAYCVSGIMTCDTRNYEQTTETFCDNLDNDCDGATDEDIKRSSNELGACTLNTETCIRGNYTRDNIFVPAEDICGDIIDNDCDGQTDETCFCNAGENKECGYNNVGECRLGTQICSDLKIWQGCTAILPVEEICDGKDNDCDGVVDDKQECCENNRIIQCFTEECNVPGLQKCVNYVWTACSAQCTDIQIIPNLGINQTVNPILNSTRILPRQPNATQNAIEIMRREQNLTQEDIENAQKTGDAINQSLSYSYEGDNTKVKHTITSENDLKDVNLYLYLPKDCVAELEKIHFFDAKLQDYKVIKEDPLIAWHFVEIKDRIDISYDIDGKISEDCLNRIKMLPIAQKVGKPTLAKFLIPILAIILISSLAIFMQHIAPPEQKDNPSSEEQLLTKTISRYVAQMKSDGIRSKADADKYMNQMSIPEKMRKEILKKF